MLRALSLSAVTGTAEANAASLTQYLSTHPPADAPTEVHLDVTNTAVTAVVDQCNALYQAATNVSISSDLRVLPKVATAVVGADNKAELGPLSPAAMTPALGYTLYGHVATGGTFDRFHGGHKMLLTRAALVTERRLRVGMTGPILLGKGKPKANSEFMQPLDVRLRVVAEFLKAVRPDLTVDVFELETGDGGVIGIPDVAAMVCSPETLPAIHGINAKRAEQDPPLPPTVPVVVEYVGGSDNDTRVSSTKLRALAAAGKIP
jgi:phosphopantetheine adenylyltransferase